VLCRRSKPFRGRGIGSDLDLITVVTDISLPFEKRSTEWDLSDLPVPAEILVHSSKELEALQKGTDKFSRMLRHEVIWTYVQDQ
jgi:hypothetical protein